MNKNFLLPLLALFSLPNDSSEKNPMYKKSGRRCVNCDEWTDNGTKFCDECTEKYKNQKNRSKKIKGELR